MSFCFFFEDATNKQNTVFDFVRCTERNTQRIAKGDLLLDLLPVRPELYLYLYLKCKHTVCI